MQTYGVSSQKIQTDCPVKQFGEKNEKLFKYVIAYRKEERRK